VTAGKRAVAAQAKTFIKAGVKAMDALHLCFRFVGAGGFFCTCDDKLLTKCSKLKSLATKVVSPLQLIAEVAP
jgi:hypothetical protein